MRAVLLFALSCIVTLPVHAEILIDDFSSGPASIDVLPLFAQVFQANVQPGTMLGGTRQTAISVQQLAPLTPPGHLRIDPGLNAFAPANSLLELQLGYVPGGVDLAREQRLAFDFLSNDSPLLLDVQISSQNGSSRAESSIAASNTPFRITIAFSELAAISNAEPLADLHDVKRIDFVFRGSPQQDARSFDLIAIRVVPEPATWTSLALGVSCAGVLTMRRRSHPKCAADRARFMRKA